VLEVPGQGHVPDGISADDVLIRVERASVSTASPAVTATVLLRLFEIHEQCRFEQLIRYFPGFG
jgi:hypothetical protein